MLLRNAHEVYAWRGYNDLDATVAPEDLRNAWHHVAVTWDGTMRSLYLDEVLIKQDQPGPANVPASNLLLGKGINNTWYFNGSIDDVAIYPTALTGDRIRAHYWLGRGDPTHLLLWGPLSNLERAAALDTVRDVLWAELQTHPVVVVRLETNELPDDLRTVLDELDRTTGRLTYSVMPELAPVPDGE